MDHPFSMAPAAGIPARNNVVLGTAMPTPCPPPGGFDEKVGGARLQPRLPTPMSQMGAPSMARKNRRGGTPREAAQKLSPRPRARQSRPTRRHQRPRREDPAPSSDFSRFSMIRVVREGPVGARDDPHARRQTVPSLRESRERSCGIHPRCRRGCPRCASGCRDPG